MQPERSALCEYRMENAETDLSDAKANFENKRYKVAINRSYYAIFHAVRAVLALSGFDSKRHSTIIGYFHQNFISDGKIAREYYKILTDAFYIRNKSDYEDFYVAAGEEAKEQVEAADKFISQMRYYLRGQ